MEDGRFRKRSPSASLPLFFAVAACSWMPHWSCHYHRLESPFRFEVIGWPWPLGASLREVGLVIGFGLACLAVAWRTRRAA